MLKRNFHKIRRKAKLVVTGFFLLSLLAMSSCQHEQVAYQRPAAEEADFPEVPLTECRHVGELTVLGFRSSDYQSRGLLTVVSRNLMDLGDGRETTDGNDFFHF